MAARAVSALLLTATLASGCVRHRPPAELGDLQLAPGEFPHHLLTEVATAYVDAEGRVNLRAMLEDRPQALERYLAHVAAVSPRSHPELFPTPDHARAYWINAYNALGLWGLLQHPGRESLAPHLLGTFAVDRYRVGGEWMTLNGLQTFQLRGEGVDPRVHFALACYAVSCPPLRQQAYTGDDLDAQLEAVTRARIADPAWVRVEDGVPWVSRVFTWYERDFEAAGGIAAFVNAHGGDVPEGVPVEVLYHDWTINLAPEAGL